MEKSSLEKSLKEGIVVFKYKKVDGTVRNAVGTLMPQSIPNKDASKVEPLTNALEEFIALDDARFDLTDTEDEANLWRERHIKAVEDAKSLLVSLTPKPVKKQADTSSVKYFDLLVGEWRSFKIENFVNLIATY